MALTLAAAGGSYLGWAVGGSVGLALAIVVLSPLLGIAFVPWGLLLLDRSVYAVRAIAYRNIEGRHYAYKGRPLVVIEDLAGDRWIETQGLRRVLPGLPRDQVLARIAAAHVGRAGRRGGLLIQAQGLDQYLQRHQDDTAIRFRNWLHHTVIDPADRARQRRGAHPGPAQPPP